MSVHVNYGDTLHMEKKFLKASWFGKMVLECVFRKINDFAVIKLSTTQLF